jgi:hypothetical protein
MVLHTQRKNMTAGHMIAVRKTTDKHHRLKIRQLRRIIQ